MTTAIQNHSNHQELVGSNPHAQVALEEEQAVNEPYPLSVIFSSQRVGGIRNGTKLWEILLVQAKQTVFKSSGSKGPCRNMRYPSPNEVHEI